MDVSCDSIVCALLYLNFRLGQSDNDFSEFRRPENYIRHIEALESDLAKTVEYDMDEQGHYAALPTEDVFMFCSLRSRVVGRCEQ